MSICIRDIGWVGRCKQPAATENPPLCEKHEKDKCWCGAPAVKDCEVASSFVCGRPLCADHDCPSGGGMFTGTSPHSKAGQRQFEEWKQTND